MNACKFCIVSELEGRKIYKVADLSEFWDGQKYIKLMDANILGCKEHLDLLHQIVQSKAYVDFTQGLDIRLVNDENIALINQLKVKNIHFAWDDARKNLVPCFERYKNLAKHKPHGHYGTVYCLTNFDSTMEENLYRIYTLRDMGYRPYVMVYDKPNAPREVRLLRRWCNNIKIFGTCPKFENYDEKRG